MHQKLEELKNLPKRAVPSKPTDLDVFLEKFNNEKNKVIDNQMWFYEYLILKSSSGGEDFYYLYNNVSIRELYKFIYKKVLGIERG